MKDETLLGDTIKVRVFEEQRGHIKELIKECPGRWENESAVIRAALEVFFSHYKMMKGYDEKIQTYINTFPELWKGETSFIRDALDSYFKRLTERGLV